MERLDKILANMGVGTRKEVKKLTRKGAVKVNGVLVTDSDIKIDEENDEITVFDQPLVYRKYVYLMLNKPSGYVSAVTDNRYPTVVELADDFYSNYDLFPVGRLDVDTEGLLVLTNDGALAHKVLSPKNHIPKKYFVKTRRQVTEEDAKLLESPMDLGDFTTIPAKVEFTTDGVVICIFEGKFHQVKRMFEKTGNEVTYLKRISMGGLCLDENLEPGEMRELRNDEVQMLVPDKI
ncbi:MAG: rRNA pseudouridine synthase [Clostridia bacterium]|nr:rRNA pseudouridine synthase [Clostridia bacterium]